MELKAYLIKIKEVQRQTSLGRSSIYNKISEGSKYYDSEFPKPVKVGQGRAIAFVQSEVTEWINSKCDDRK